MAFQPAPQIVEATLSMLQDGVPVVNRWNVDVGHPVTHSDLTGVFAAIDGWVTASLQHSQVSALSYETITVKDMSTENGEELVFVPTTLAGAVGTAPLPNSTAAVASLRTASTGKNFRGRTYLGGLAQAALEDSTHLKVSSATTITELFTDLLDALTGAGYKLVVLSRWLNKALRATALATEVISIIVDTKFDSQRRRTAN